ncbi:hypothetical protein [Bremerella cremea]|uniref:hypothetical protein n=1 Tax=Bremerella cremea TaxID=1031537 RepID=UPI0031EFC559
MSEINDFDTLTSEQIVAELRKAQREVQNLRRQFHKLAKRQQPTSIYLARVTETAAAIDGNVAGRGKARLLSVTSSGDLAEKSSPTTFFNAGQRMAQVGDVVTLTREPHSGRLLVSAGAGQGDAPFDTTEATLPAAVGTGFGNNVTLLFGENVANTPAPTARQDLTLTGASKARVGTDGYRRVLATLFAAQSDTSFNPSLPMKFAVELWCQRGRLGGNFHTAVFTIPPRQVYGDDGSGTVANRNVGHSTDSGGQLAYHAFSVLFSDKMQAGDELYLLARSQGNLKLRAQTVIGPAVVL